MTRILTPGDRRDRLMAEIGALREASGRLCECASLADVRELVHDMISERRADAVELDELERDRLDHLVPTP